jgi:hypothetical protein
MKISSGNLPAFGCGACAQMKKIAENSGKKVDYKQCQNNLEMYKKVDGMTHGQAASSMLKYVKNFLGLK